jgi:putative flavoprotein involved in K+ transport
MNTGNNVIVIGAGAAGLAAAAELHRARVPFVVLERADVVGAAWRDRYDRLRLNSSRPTSKLPAARYPRGTGMFPSRDDVGAYLRDFAARRPLDIRFGVQVERVDREGAGWRVRTASGDLSAAHVIVATGRASVPVVPDWPGRDDYGGELLHSADYRSPNAFRDRDVLVAGAGCSGMEIAYDLVEGGARRVRVAVRTPPNFLLRSAVGVVLARAMMHLPTERADAIMRVVRRKTIGDLTEYGLPAPDEGIFSLLKRRHVTPTIVDPPVIEAIRERRIEIVAGVASLDAGGVRLADGARVEPDAVIAATGYRTGLEPVVGHLGVLDDEGAPLVIDGEAAPGLRFLGYIARPALFGRLGEEARDAAQAISRRPRNVPRPQRQAEPVPVRS